MLYEVEGDLMLSRAQVLVQSVAVEDPMTRGLARKLHNKYPALVSDYADWCEQEKPEPGMLWLWGEPGQAQIVNLITHTADEDPRRQRRPDKIALNRCFRALNRLALDERFKSMAMPTIGAGEFGFDWAEVRGMMDSQLGELLIPVFIYVTELDGQLAHEPGL
jgi:O-acetyl-ADP-ribose deacetylase (regulator of RNase III)